MRSGNVVTCVPYHLIPPRGWLRGDNPFDFSTPELMLQIAMSAFATRSIDFFLRRYGLCSYFSNAVGAVIIGPILLGNIKIIKESIFSNRSLYVLETVQSIGDLFYMFLVGLKMDFQMVNGSGRKAVLIGVSVGFAPLLVTTLTAFLFNILFSTTPKLCSLYAVAISQGQTSFHVVACFLADLKILNSEIGRLAIASSMISNIFCWSVMQTTVALVETSTVGRCKATLMIGSILGLAVLIVYVMKPIMHWMIQQISEGTNEMQEVHVFVIFLMVMVCAFLGQCMGHAPGMGPLLLGLTVPPGPPLAETIEDKLEPIVSSVFLPLFYVASCGKISSRVTDSRLAMFVVLIIVLAFATKMIGAVLSSIYSGVSSNDAVVLGLIIASQGLVDLIHFSRSLGYNYISVEVYTVLIYSSVMIAGITSVSVKVMYKPSMNYLSYKKRTLGDNMQNTEFRILACIYSDSNVPSIIDLLKVSNVTDESPINLYLLHIIELQRIAPPFLISHKKNGNSSIYYNRSEHIFNAFQFFEEQYKDNFLVNAFSSLSPSTTMHQDICLLAVNKRVSLIILPFHRQFNLDGIMEAKTATRNVNSSVLEVSPCSVAILIDRRRISSTSSITQSKSFFHIALIFLGGADDREVLTYGERMVENPNTILTVIRFSLISDTSNNPTKEKKLDAMVLQDFRSKYIGKEGINYREEVVTDGLGIVKAMREIEDKFDLIMVGRQHEKKTELFKGLSEWNEYPELGLMGDMLATSNMHEDVSILVLQKKLQIDKLVHADYTIHI
ncbi:hypothetical protein ACHQM5_012612 [Ranunculus cassubicifolius]